MNKQIFVALICLASNATAFAQTITPSFSNVDYVGKNHVRQKLDIYIPAGLIEPAPVIVHIHGGGWYGGSKGAANIPFFQNSYNAGFVCVDINYRLSGDSLWPAQIFDCKAAIRFLKVHAAEYNIDTCRFGVIGGSAGGHLVAMLGTSADVPALEGIHQGNVLVSSRVQAVVDMFGPTDFLQMDGHYSPSCGTGLVHNQNSPETHVLGCDSLQNCPDRVASANPLTYTTADDAAFFIIHGSNDCTVPTYQSVILDSALAAAGIPADTFLIAANQGHGGGYYSGSIRTAMYHSFFVQHLSVPCAASSTGEPNHAKQFVSLRPNPANHQIYLDLLDPGVFEVLIFNAFGRAVKSVENQLEISVSDLPAGVYWLELRQNRRATIQKLIKI